MEVQLNSNYLPIQPFHEGKVRTVYDLEDSFLLVVTDRISAFDVVFEEGIPDKGKILNQISAFWFDKTAHIVENHMLSTNPATYPLGLNQYQKQLEKRSMWVKKLNMLPVECIVRGYLEGSAWSEYQNNQTVSGILMPDGLRQGDKLPEPLFTPSTKAEEGHDENITFEQLKDSIGLDLAERLKQASLKLYQFGWEYAQTKGLILADSKFEFGLIGDSLILGDELFTPDSSRFWDAKTYSPGKAQISFDKQYLREWLSTLDWDKNYPAPSLPQDIIGKTQEKYREAYAILVGEELV